MILAAISTLGELFTGETQTAELAMTTKADLIFVASKLVTRIATHIILLLNYVVILEGRKTPILYSKYFLRKLKVKIVRSFIEASFFWQIANREGKFVNLMALNGCFLQLIK